MIDTFLKVWRVGSEHSGAWSEALKSIENGGSYMDAARAFADHTSHDLDDAAVEQIAELLEQAVEVLHQAATSAGRLSAWIEMFAPSVLSAIRRAGVVALQIASRLDSLKRDRPV